EDATTASLVCLSSGAEIANRVSNFFDLKGPSLAIDSMCASSALAIHVACSDLLRGECRTAIAAGVNLLIHPSRYIGLSHAKLIGSRPSSRSFAAGDGYLPSEGVGAVLLKPLHDAIRDRDHIWAVIRATGTSHSGRGSAYAVPDPKAQADLIESVVRKAAIDARTITYVEAAATGSPLGDAVELTALNQAFRKFTQDRHFCALGTVKSNIGHAEAASGVSQLTKVMLQMKHRAVAPLLPIEAINPNLSLSDSPFRLLRELEEWRSPADDGAGSQQIPRRALLNSFGAGGSYVSMVIEEFMPEEGTAPRNVPETDEKPQIIVLSARDEPRLRLVAERLLAHVSQPESARLADIAYTLQRRERLGTRLAFVVPSMEQLRSALSAYLDSDGHPDSAHAVVFYKGDENARLVSSRLLSGAAADAFVRTLVAERKLEQLALLWSEGADVPLDALIEPDTTRTVALPGYPFERDRYWLTPGEPQISEEKGEPRPDAPLHPLLHRERSTAEGVEFTSVFTGAEWFLKDHEQLVPAVAYLEMARVAGEVARRKTVVGIRNALWVSPLTIDAGACDVRIRLQTEHNGWGYTVRTTGSAGGSRGPTIHAQGLLVFDDSAGRPGRPPALDVDQLRSRCRTATDRTMRNRTM
ncbi:MAG: beta-ketoacyl synthase N-terminal-like domain-containing protein, partial [Steroidobacteraceae bacterium]